MNLVRIAIAAGAILLVGCGQSNSTQSGSSGARIRLIPILASGPAASARQIAGTAGSDLQSFEVAISDVTLARDLTVSGTAYTGMTGGLPLFSNQGMGDYNTILTDSARSATFRRNYVDLTTFAGLAKLSSEATFDESAVGAYNYVVVNWARAFLVRAQVHLPDGSTLCTHDGTVFSTPLSGGGVLDSLYQTRTTRSLRDCPPEDAVVVKNNGGTWFKFRRPLQIAASDLTDTAQVVDSTSRDSLGRPVVRLVPKGQLGILMVFNPDDFVLGWDSVRTGDNGFNSPLVGPDGGFSVPFLDATAVPFRQGDSVVRETWSLSGHDASSGSSFKVRVELYLGTGDNILAASLRSLPTGDGNIPMESPKVAFADSSGSALLLEDWQHTPILSGFVRGGPVGASLTVDANLGGLSAPGSTLTLVERRRLI